jgi:hypothetical protein
VTREAEGTLGGGDTDAQRQIAAGLPGGRDRGVPGMPPGSPGMEVPGSPADPYRVFLFDRNGKKGGMSR